MFEVVVITLLLVIIITSLFISTIINEKLSKIESEVVLAKQQITHLKREINFMRYDYERND
jgi:hypothetical protein